jgi:hypothetical protein
LVEDTKPKKKKKKVLKMMHLGFAIGNEKGNQIVAKQELETATQHNKSHDSMQCNAMSVLAKPRQTRDWSADASVLMRQEQQE